MSNALESALIEASNPSTSPERLRALSLRKRKNERNQLRPVIAANPNAEEDLLLELAADHPKEVIGNPRFKLLELAGEVWWENCELHSLCSLALAAGEGAPPFLKLALRSLFQQIYDQYRKLVSIERKETWLYERRVEICAYEFDGEKPPFNIYLDVDLGVLMEGSSRPFLEIGDSADGFGRDWICMLVRSLHHKCIESVFDVFGQKDFLDNYIAMEDAIGESIELDSPNEEVRIDGFSVLNKETGQLLFSANVYWGGHCDDEPPTRFEDGVLSVPVSECSDCTVEGFSRGSSDDLGDLEPLWGWEPPFLAPGIHAYNWEDWLSGWMMS